MSEETIQICGGPLLLKKPSPNNSWDRCKLCDLHLDHNRCDLAKCYDNSGNYFIFEIQPEN